MPGPDRGELLLDEILGELYVKKDEDTMWKVLRQQNAKTYYNFDTYLDLYLEVRRMTRNGEEQNDTRKYKGIYGPTGEGWV